MAAITKISINITTSSDSNSGTDGDVYVGFCGREFYLDTSADDFERGSSRSYVCGDGANILSKPLNDPRSPPLQDTDIDRFPVYVRFVGKSRNDNWKVQRVNVSYNDQLFPQYELLLRDGIWMGTHATSVVFIKKHTDAKDAAS